MYFGFIKVQSISRRSELDYNLGFNYMIPITCSSNTVDFPSEKKIFWTLDC